MAHFVAFCIGFQKNIPLQNPPGGRRVYGSSRSIKQYISLQLLYRRRMVIDVKLAEGLNSVKQTAIGTIDA